MSRNDTVIYFTFDDGPHPAATAYVLDTLKQYNAKATFFCIGKNVAAYPDIYKRILSEGHRIGNQHSITWMVGKHPTRNTSAISMRQKIYRQRILPSSIWQDQPFPNPIVNRRLKIQANVGLQIMMWDVLSADFDTWYQRRKMR